MCQLSKKRSTDLSLGELSLNYSSDKNEKSVIIYASSRHSKPVGTSFFCKTQKEMLNRILRLPFCIKMKVEKHCHAPKWPHKITLKIVHTSLALHSKSSEVIFV